MKKEDIKTVSEALHYCNEKKEGFLKRMSANNQDGEGIYEDLIEGLKDGYIEPKKLNKFDI